MSNSPVHSIPQQASDVGPSQAASLEQPQLSDFKLYKPSTRPAASPAHLPDEYFTPTPTDLKAAQAMLSARTQALNNAPLQLRAVREAESRAKRDRWPETTIRIRFADQTQLEKVFPSTNKIRSVYAFVRACLREDIKPIKFILYQSPPKRDLKVSDPAVRDITLAELQLAPSSILLLRFDDDKLNHSHVPPPLAPEVIAQAVDLPVSPPPVVIEANNTNVETIPSTGTKSVESKIPKWLKLAQKK
ncbi:hypothetical protein BYT27DRAFT_7341316 [Phlegmacium glaucopus]|nr:hypothetical protein BYT27DRAFT_7341316 [Phlegmacium glaucopus]